MAKQLNVNLAFTADTSQAKAQLQDLQNQLTNLTKIASNGNNFSLSKEILEANKAALVLKENLTAATSAKTGKLDLGMFKQQMESSGMSLKKYEEQLSKLGPDGSKAFSSLASSITQAEIPLRRSNTLLSEFATSLKNTARWQISSSALHGFMGALQSAYGYAQDLNASLTNIQIVTGQTTDQMAKFADAANKSAQALSTTTTKYTDAALIFYQQGLDDKAVQERTDATIKMSQATGDAVKDVSSYMTAIWNNFDDGSQSLEHYADVITALGASTASSSSEIASGLQQFAAIAETTGLSYEYATSALATLVANTRQSADTIGNSLKTIFSRLQGLKLGETLEDGVDLNKYSKALQAIGVDLLDVNGNMMQMDDILDATAEKWDTMSQSQKMAFAQTVAGTRQYTQLMSLMDNWDDMQTNLNTVNAADGTLQEQADIYANSWEAAQQRVKAAAQEIYGALLNDKFFIELNNGFASFLNLISNTIDGLGGLKGVLLTLGAIVTTVFQDSLARGIENAIYNIQMLTEKGRENIRAVQTEANQLLINGSRDNGSTVGANMATAYEQQALLQQTYLDNANSLSEVEKTIAASMLDQQKVLIGEVNQSAQLLQNAEGQANLQARKLSKDAVGDLSSLKEMQSIMEQTGVAEGFMSKALDNVGSKIKDVVEKQDIDELKQFVQAIEESGVDIQLAYGPEAQNAFNTLRESLKNLNTDMIDASTLTTITEQFDKLFSTTATGGLEDAVEKVTQELLLLKNAQGEAVYSEEEARQKALELADSYRTVGQHSADTAQKQSLLASYTNSVSEALQKASERNITLGEGLNAYARTIMSVGSAISGISGLIKTWGDDSKSVGEKLLATFTTLGMIVPTLTTAFSANSVAAMANAGSQLLVATGLMSEATAAGIASGATASFGVVLYSVLAPLALIAAAIALVVGAFIGLKKIFESIEANSMEGKLKSTKEEAKNLADAANEAKDKAHELKSAFDSYDSVVDKLENCTKGTQEWRDAMEEVNNQVIDMLQKYPELASYLDSSDPSGLLKFKDGYEDVLAEAQNAANSASLASIRKNADVQQQQVDLDKRNFYKDNNINSSQQKIIDENLDKFASIPFELLDSKIEGLSGISAEAYGELQKLSAASAAATAGLENVGAIAANSLDPDKYSQEARNMVANGYNDLVDKNKSDVLNEIGQFKRVGDNVGNNSNLKNLWDEYQKYGGQSGDLNKNSLRGWDAGQGRIKEFAYNDDNGDLKKVTAEQVAETIAAGRAMEQLGASADQASSALNSLDKKATEGVSEGIKGFINNGNLENLTQGDMQSIRKQVGEDGSGTEKYLQNLFGTDDLKSLGIDPDAFNEALENAETAFDSFKDGFSKYVTNAFDDLDLSGLTLSAQKAVLEALNDAFAIGGVDGLNAMQDIFKSLAPEEAELFANTINNIDWNSNSVDSLRSTLQDLGIDTTNLSDGALQNLISAMREASATADDLASAFKSQKDVLGKLKDGDMISEEDYGKLDAAYQEYFAKQMDGSYKLIGSAEKLQETLQKDYEQKFLNRASDLKQQSDGLKDVNPTTIQGSALTSAQGSEYIDTDKAQSQLTLLNAIGEQYGINKEKLSEWNAQMADGSANAQTYKEIAQAISEISVNEDMLTEASARCNEEIAQIAEQLLASQTSYEGFQSALSSLFGEGISVPLEAIVMGLESLASQYPSCAEAAETYANSSKEVEEAVKAETEAREYLNSLEDRASGSAIANATTKLEEAQAYREATQEKMAAAQWDLELGILAEEASSAYGIEADRIKDLAEAFAEENELAAENAEIARDLAVRNLRLNDAAADLTTNWKKYSDIMDLVSDGTEDQIKAAKKEIAQTESLSKSFDSLKKSTAGLLNTSEKMFGDDFVLKNMKDIKKAAEGDEDALKRLQKAAAKEITIQLDNKGVFDKLGESADAVADWASNLPEGELGIDDTIYLQKLVNAMQQAGMTQAEIEDALGGLGIDVDLAPYEEGLNTVIDEAMEAGKLASDAFASNAGIDTEVKQETDTTTDEKELLGYDVTEEPIPLSGSITTSGTFGGNLAAVVPGNATFSGTYPGVNVTPVTETATQSQDTTSTALEVIGANKSSGGNISRSNSSGGRGGGGGGKGSKGRPKRSPRGREERREYAAKQHTDRSHTKYDTLTKTLETMQKSYERVSTAADHAFGTQKLKLIDKQIEKQKALKKQLDLVAKEAKNVANKDKKKLRSQTKVRAYYEDKDGKEQTSEFSIKQALGFNVDIDKDGVIQNMGDIQKALDKRHNDAAKNVDGKTGDAAAEAKAQLAKIDAENEEILRIIEQYESDWSQYLDDKQAAFEAQYEIISKTMERIQANLDMKIDASNRGLERLDKLLGRIKDNGWHAAESIALLAKQQRRLNGYTKEGKNYDTVVTGQKELYQQTIIDTINTHNATEGNRNLGFTGEEFAAYLNGDLKDAEKIKKMRKAINNAKDDSVGLTDIEIETIKNAIDGLQEYVDQTIAIVDEAFKHANRAFELIVEEMDLVSNKMEHLANITKHYQNIVDIVGAKALGITTEMQIEMNAVTVQEAQSLVTASKEKVSAIEQALKKTRKSLAEAEAAGVEEEIEYWKEMERTQEEALRNAEEEFMQNWEDALQAARDAFAANVELIANDLGDKLAGAKSSLDALSESFNMAKEINEDYVKDYEKAYLLDKMRRDVAKDIDESNNLKVKKELLAVQEKINTAMENGEKMSQYEIDNLQREYELTKARLALEEASEIKSEVTLTRDSEGNYSYVYGVNMEEVAKAEDEYNKKLYEMQKANDDYINDLEEKIINLQNEAVSKLQQAAEMYGTDSEEYAAAMAEIQEWYSTQLDFYTSQMNIALQNNQDLCTMVTESNIGAFGRLGYTYEDNIRQFDQTVLAQTTGYETLEDLTTDSTGAMIGAIDQLKGAQATYQSQNEETMRRAGTTMNNFKKKYSQNMGDSVKATKKLEKEAKAVKKKVVNNFTNTIKELKKLLPEYRKVMKEYKKEIEEWAKQFEDVYDYWTGLKKKVKRDNGGSRGGNTPKTNNDPPKTNDDPKGRRDELKVGKKVVLESGKFYNDSEGDAPIGNKKGQWNGKSVYITRIVDSSHQYPYHISTGGKLGDGDLGWIKKSQLKGFDTGGYTGDEIGPNGSLAILHNKELVLNKDDTKNFLSGIEILRGISQMIDLNALAASASVVGGLRNIGSISGLSKEILEQFVNITAEFPNINSKQEILDAFDNIVNLASQYASRT